ncbi:terminase [Mycobacterium sp.]|uniref:terminase n=1 Tax=Mycobacterium sp. TaxID=1785 RepID=UPI003F98717B
MTEIQGCETPRIFTPPLRPLTPETSHGFAAIKFAEGLGFKLFPWQRFLLVHGLELDPDDDSLYRFRTVVCEVARQSGKSFAMLILALWHIYVRDSRTVLGTAQDLATSEKTWAEAVAIAESDEELSALIEKITLGHPKSLKLITGPEYRVATASRRGGRGFSANLVLLDELREHQGWDSWAATTKTMMARPRAQAWCFSNAGDSMSIVLKYLRAQAHRELGWPDGDGDKEVLGDLAAELEELDDGRDYPVGWFEWSASPHAQRTDTAAWAQANPSLNHTEITEDCVTSRALMHALKTDPPHVFETEILCRWSSAGDVGPFPEGSWQETLDDSARPVAGGRQVVCVDVSWNRSRSYIARCGHDAEGVPVVGIAEDKPGTDWVVDWLIAHRDTFETIVVQSNGAPVTSLLPDIENVCLPDGSAAGLPVIAWKGTDLSSATSMLFDRLESRKIRHASHPGLDAAATSAAVKVLGAGGWVIDRAKSPTDAAPLIAVIGAAWAAETLGQPAEYDVLASVL